VFLGWGLVSKNSISSFLKISVVLIQRTIGLFEFIVLGFELYPMAEQDYLALFFTIRPSDGKNSIFCGYSDGRSR
jgi:hypothetical protein